MFNKNLSTEPFFSLDYQGKMLAGVVCVFFVIIVIFVFRTRKVSGKWRSVFRPCDTKARWGGTSTFGINWMGLIDRGYLDQQKPCGMNAKPMNSRRPVLSLFEFNSGNNSVKYSNPEVRWVWLRTDVNAVAIRNTHTHIWNWGKKYDHNHHGQLNKLMEKIYR